MEETIRILFRKPRFREGEKIHDLIKSSPPLDLNSSYAYFILCRDFTDHSIVAEIDNKIVGYISAYIRPKKDNTLFVWQVVVSKKVRGLGIAKKMLTHIIKDLSADVTIVETTISPSNKASQKIFTRYAKENGHPITKSPFLSEDDFSGEGHEAEELYQIDLSKKIEIK